MTMPTNSIFLFEYRHEQSGGAYDIYLFKDFSGIEGSDQADIFAEIDLIRKRIHSPEKIIVICESAGSLDKEKLEGRFTEALPLEYFDYIDYENISDDIFHKGASEIIRRNKIVQISPEGTLFKHPSGKELNYFIKASLALIEYPEICFLSLALINKIGKERIQKFRKIYIDTSAILPLIQSAIYYINKKCDFNPKIINFKSYTKNEDTPSAPDLNSINSFTIISASTSGRLREKLRIEDDKYLTLFYPKDKNNNEKYLFGIEGTSKNTHPSPRLIPLTSEDFSVEYSMENETLIVKEEVEKMDTEDLIPRLLSNGVKKIQFEIEHSEVQKREVIKFEIESLLNFLEKEKFIEDAFLRSCTSEADNTIVCDESSYTFIKKIIKTEPKHVEIKKLLGNSECNNIDDKNIIIFLPQATYLKLTKISQKLRKYKYVKNISYIIGILVTDDFGQSKNLENNICFNNKKYKYNFYCCLDLPVGRVTQPTDVLREQRITNGFVFYKKEDASNLTANQVFLTVYLILQLLRANEKLHDNIAYYYVISPKNFSRFNDSLLQLSILHSSEGRELCFQSNSQLSNEMKDVILDLMKENKDVGKEFINALKKGIIKLTKDDESAIKKACPLVFKRKSRDLESI